MKQRKYIIYHNCKYILLVDDDYLVNVDETLQFVSSLQRNNTSSTMFGPIVECWKPVRTMDDPNSYITKEEYPWELYPPYLSGGSILTTLDVVRQRLALSDNLNLLSAYLI
jgi:hypothetical protein